MSEWSGMSQFGLSLAEHENAQLRAEVERLKQLSIAEGRKAIECRARLAAAERVVEAARDCFGIGVSRGASLARLADALAEYDREGRGGG